MKRNPRRNLARCGKRPEPVSLGIREDGEHSPPVRTVLTADGTLTEFVNGAPVDMGKLPPENSLYGTRAVQQHQQGVAVAPRSAMTVYVVRGTSPRTNFRRKWEALKVRFHALTKGTMPCTVNGETVQVPCPVADPRGFVYAVDGPSEVLFAMTADPRCHGYSVAVLSRHALGSGEFARKPRPKGNPVRKHTCFRTVNGAPCFVRI